MRAPVKGFNSILIISLMVILSLGAFTSARDDASSVSANCDECHASSIYLVMDIQSVEGPSFLMRNETTSINVTVEVSSSHKSYVWSGFSMDVWLTSATDRTYCGPHQILNGQKPHGPTSPFIWSETFTFNVNSSFNGNEIITINARMSPIHESPPVTARMEMVLQVAKDVDDVILSVDDTGKNYIPVSGGKEKPKLGPLGLAIILIGALALFSGVSYAVYSLIAPVKTGNGKGRKGGK